MMKAEPVTQTPSAEECLKSHNPHPASGHPLPLPRARGKRRGTKNSRRKGKVGEREFAALLRDHGFDARRGQQFSGGAESPDVVSDALAWLHIEVKRTQALNLADACAQAEGDCAGKPWIVAHRRNHAPWLITMRAETFFDFLRGVLPPEEFTNNNQTTRSHNNEQPSSAM